MRIIIIVYFYSLNSIIKWKGVITLNKETFDHAIIKYKSKSDTFQLVFKNQGKSKTVTIIAEKVFMLEKEMDNLYLVNAHRN